MTGGSVRDPQMWAELLVALLALALFAYWFRRNCLAALKSQAIREQARRVAEANHLSFFEVRRRLEVAAEPDGFDSMGRALTQDYRILSFLLRHTGGTVQPRRGLMTRMLMLDFRLMQLWFRLTRRWSRRQARRALEEMSSILGHLADAMGQRPAPVRSGASRA
jgi:hypothetical protein